MNCVRFEISPYAESCDELAGDDFETVNNFYVLMNNRKLAIHCLPVRFYEEYLTMSETKRKSIGSFIKYLIRNILFSALKKIFWP